MGGQGAAPGRKGRLSAALARCGDETPSSGAPPAPLDVPEVHRSAYRADAERPRPFRCRPLGRMPPSPPVPSLGQDASQPPRCRPFGRMLPSPPVPVFRRVQQRLPRFLFLNSCLCAGRRLYFAGEPWAAYKIQAFGGIWNIQHTGAGDGGILFCTGTGCLWHRHFARH